MVKGLSRKVIIVKSPDSKIFEQAIFIVRDDYMMSAGIDQKELMRQAKQAANGYIEQTYGRNRRRVMKVLLFGAGVLAFLSTTAIILHYFL